MQCVDCHFKQDNHGNGKLYSEPRNLVEIACADCHGTTRRPAYGQLPQWTMITTGPGAPPGGTNLRDLSTPFGQPRFTLRGRNLFQRSMTDENLQWQIPQVVDSISANTNNPKARLAHTMQRDGKTWGDGTSPNLAHADERVACATCHSSWMTSCFGCHLPQRANEKRPALHNEVRRTRATGRSTTSRCCATTSSCSARTARWPVAASRRRGRRARSSSARRTRAASGSTSSSRRCRPKATRVRRSTPTCRTPCAAPRPRPAPTATSRPTATTTP